MSLEIDELLPVAIHSILETGAIDCDFYLLDDSNRYALHRRRGVPFSDDDLHKLNRRGIKCIYISVSDAETYRDHLRSASLNDNAIPPLRRLEIIREASHAVVEEAWQRGGMEGIVWVTHELAEQLTSLITSEEFVIQDLMDLMLFDYSAYAHATNVCSLAVVIAKSYGTFDRESMVQLANGALLHDLGKQLIKRGRSSSDADHKEHPLVGFKKLAAHKQLSWGSLMMIYQHHEQIDGHGYPVGVPSDEIHEWAKICAVANYYEKHRRRFPLANAANLHKIHTALASKSGTMLDEEITACLLSLIESHHCVEA